MRPLALGWTAYLFATNILFLITRGTYHSPDRWAELYTLVLAAYAGGPEVKQWVRGTEPTDTDTWMEKVRKGGPLVVGWNVLLAAAGALRLYDPTWPMPDELKAITMQITALFFGTYALRQARKRSMESAVAGESDAAVRQKIMEYLKTTGPSTPAALSEALGIPRRSLARHLNAMVADKSLTRKARYPTDPTATYHIVN